MKKKNALGVNTDFICLRHLLCRSKRELQKSRMRPKQAKNSGSREKGRKSGMLRLTENRRLLRAKEEKL